MAGDTLILASVAAFLMMTEALPLMPPAVAVTVKVPSAVPAVKVAWVRSPPLGAMLPPPPGRDQLKLVPEMR